MKRWIVFLVVLGILCGCFSGCGKKPAEVGEKPLTIAYGEDTAWCFPALDSVISGMEAEGVVVEVQKYDTEAEMDEAVSEQLKTGQAPDVILSTNYGTLDYEGLATEGYFADLTTWAEMTFSPQEHYTNILEGCKIGGKQYAVPLTFSIPMILTMEAKMAEAGISLSEDYTGKELMEQLLAGYVADEVTQYAVTWGSTGYDDLPLAAALGIPLTDGVTALPEEEAFIEMEKFAKLFDEQMMLQVKMGGNEM